MKRLSVPSASALSPRGRAHKRGRRPNLEALEERRLLAAGIAQAPAIADGVDDLAFGDVNGDQFIDLLVAHRESGHFKVTIYSGIGEDDRSSPTRVAHRVLARMEDPLGADVGPLDLGVGDFDDDGVSDLAISSTGTQRNGGSPVVKVWRFELDADSPLNSKVTPLVLTDAFVPSGMARATGLTLEGADLKPGGADELVIAPSGAGASTLQVLSYRRQQGDWKPESPIFGVPLSLNGGASLGSGDLDGDGSEELVVGSMSNGVVGVYSPARSRWIRTLAPLGTRAGGVRVAVVPNVNAPGAIVVASANENAPPQAAIVPWGVGPTKAFRPTKSPGSGAFIPLGGGYVYQHSTIVDADDDAKTSKGPVAPTVLLGSTRGDQVIVQGFLGQYSTLAPSAPDTYIEPLTAAGEAQHGWTRLQPVHDPAATGSRDPEERISSPLVVYQGPEYRSPYKVDLSSAPDTIYQGLLNPQGFSSPQSAYWGPAHPVNTPPTVPSDRGSEWLRQRLLAAYKSMIGVDYQHHHDPRWQPVQGVGWNVAGTVGYQSRGVDCTNFTAYSYANALGIWMNADTKEQAKIGPDYHPKSLICIPREIRDRVELKRIDRGGWMDYGDLVHKLKPGDILFIAGGSDPDKVTHAITWLGDYGVDENGRHAHLIIDSTGPTPQHVDSRNHIVEQGVHVRPFGDADSENPWYFTHLHHVLRIIKD